MSAYFLTAAIGYFLGSIPFGYLLVHIFHGEDVRLSGSGNIGATNVSRKSPGLGVATLVLDAGKGAAAVMLARHFFAAGDGNVHGLVIANLAAVSAVIGHLYPVWLKFRGGKGVATSLGGFGVIAPWAVLAMVGVFVVVLLSFRYVSLGSIVAAVLLPLLTWLLYKDAGSSVVLGLISTASLLVIWKHRANMQRVLAGTEAKFGRRR